MDRTKGKVMAVCISEKKGTVKEDVGGCEIITDFGLKGDAHAGSERQVSLLSYEKVENFKREAGNAVSIRPGAFGENLLISGIDPVTLHIGAYLRVGEALLRVTQIGKTCHTGCEISKVTGKCIMPSEGVFARVIEGGEVRVTNEVSMPLTAAVITSSDRSYAGEREDKSGPVIEKMLKETGYAVTEKILIPDEEDAAFKELTRLSDESGVDLILTTGGTGFSMRDCMPEATIRVADRNVPGISEAIRAYSMTITGRAMLSRAVSVIRGRTLIINLPGSPKAVRECLEYILPQLEHGILILRGEADG